MIYSLDPDHIYCSIWSASKLFAQVCLSLGKIAKGQVISLIPHPTLSPRSKIWFTEQERWLYLTCILFSSFLLLLFFTRITDFLAVVTVWVHKIWPFFLFLYLNMLYCLQIITLCFLFLHQNTFWSSLESRVSNQMRGNNVLGRQKKNNKKSPITLLSRTLVPVTSFVNK